MGDLIRKVAVVTGGASGIGKGISECLSEAGASVVIADVNVAAAEEVAAQLPAAATAVEHDVRSAASAARLDEAIQDRFGRLDIIVNNAGVGPKPTPLPEMSEEEWDRVMDINARGVFLTTRALVPRLIAQESGRIINISSVVGETGKAMVVHYTASKFAVRGMTQSMALEFARYGVTANAICPGVVVTDLHTGVVSGFGSLQERSDEETWEWFRQRIPTGRFQTAREIGETAAFIASDRAGNITGASFNVDGGAEMH